MSSNFEVSIYFFNLDLIFLMEYEDFDITELYKAANLPQYDPEEYEPVREKEIGVGQFGVVYLYKNKKTNQQYALKQLYPNKLNPNSINEIEIMHKLVHPCLCGLNGSALTINSCGDIQLSLLLPYLSKGNLISLIDSNDPNWDTTAKMKALYGIACGMQFMHENQTVHCDLKSENILVDEKYEIKISDFGVSQTLSKNNRRLTDVTGTPFYMAPEIFMDEPYNEKVDVFAYGVIMYDILCTTKKPQKKSLLFLADEIIGGYRLPIDETQFQYSKDFLKLIRDCWAYPPKVRPPFSYILMMLPSILPPGTDVPEFQRYAKSVNPRFQRTRTRQRPAKSIAMGKIAIDLHSVINNDKEEMTNKQKMDMNDFLTSSPASSKNQRARSKITAINQKRVKINEKPQENSKIIETEDANNNNNNNNEVPEVDTENSKIIETEDTNNNSKIEFSEANTENTKIIETEDTNNNNDDSIEVPEVDAENTKIVEDEDDIDDDEEVPEVVEGDIKVIEEERNDIDDSIAISLDQMKNMKVGQSFAYRSKAAQSADPSKRLDILATVKQQAQMGNPKELYNYAMIQYSGTNGVAKDVEGAIANVKEAARLGNTEACYWLGMRYFKGTDGFDINLKESRRNIQIAADNDYPLALFFMGFYDQRGLEMYPNDIDPNTLTAEERSNYIWPVNKKDGFKYSKLAAKKGHAMSALMVARSYENGVKSSTECPDFSIRKNEGKATQYYKMAADSGDVSSMVKFGQRAEEGIGMKKNVGLAMKYLKNAVRLDNMHALFIVGKHYYKGTGGFSKNQRVAAELIKKAADKGLPDAQMLYSKILKKGCDGIEKNKEESKKYETLAKRAIK